MGAQNPSQPEDSSSDSDAATPHIPGQRTRSTWTEPTVPDDDSDPGWMLHEGGGSGAFDGWLYHYADGTMVDADGVEYRIAPPGDQGSTTGSVDAAPDQVSDPEPAEDHLEPAPGSETDSGTEPERPQLRAVADDEDAGDLAHEAADEDPAQDQDDEEADAADEADPTAEQPDEPASDEASVQTDDAPAPEAARPQATRPSDVPAFVEYSPTAARGYLLGAVFVVAAVAGVLTAFVAVSEDSSAALVVAGGCVVLALVAWWALLSWRPVVVTIRDGVLEVERGGQSETFDLTDPATTVEFRGRPGPAWTAILRQGNGPRTLLRPSHVKPRQFERIVRHHRPRTDPTSPAG